MLSDFFRYSHLLCVVFGFYSYGYFPTDFHCILVYVLSPIFYFSHCCLFQYKFLLHCVDISFFVYVNSTFDSCSSLNALFGFVILFSNRCVLSIFFLFYIALIAFFLLLCRANWPFIPQLLHVWSIAGPFCVRIQVCTLHILHGLLTLVFRIVVSLSIHCIRSPFTSSSPWDSFSSDVVLLLFSFYFCFV